MGSEGSVEQNRGLTNRNRISGIPGRTSGRLIAKSISIKGQGCRSGRGAGKAIELTWGGLCRVPISELREPQGDLTAAQESAEGIVGPAVGKASEALQGRKAEQQIGRAGNDGRRPERLGVASRTGDSGVVSGRRSSAHWPWNRLIGVNPRSAVTEGPNH